VAELGDSRLVQIQSVATLRYTLTRPVPSLDVSCNKAEPQHGNSYLGASAHGEMAASEYGSFEGFNQARNSQISPRSIVEHSATSVDWEPRRAELFKRSAVMYMAKVL
jgi:hypothetical protein